MLQPVKYFQSVATNIMFFSTTLCKNCFQCIAYFISQLTKNIFDHIDITFLLIIVLSMVIIMSVKNTIIKLYWFVHADSDYFSEMVLLNYFPQKSTKGSIVLDYVFRNVNLMETEYFGLRYCDRSHQTVSDT